MTDNIKYQKIKFILFNSYDTKLNNIRFNCMKKYKKTFKIDYKYYSINFYTKSYY